MITTVAITSYNLDCYPEGSGEVVRFQTFSLCCLKSMLIYGSMQAAWINFARTTGELLSNQYL